MSQVTSTPPGGEIKPGSFNNGAIFSAEAEDAVVRRWGPIFSVFGDDLERVLAGAAEAAPESQTLAEDVYAAARRYGALLEVMCGSADGSRRPCTVYDCCDGVSVLLLPQRPTSLQDAEEALAAFENEKTSIEEHIFAALLSNGILAYFSRNVVDPAGMVTVSVGGGDYCFMRAEQRDAILQKLHIATSADTY